MSRSQTPVGSEEPTDAELRAYAAWRESGHISLRGAFAHADGVRAKALAGKVALMENLSVHDRADIAALLRRIGEVLP